MTTQVHRGDVIWVDFTLDAVGTEKQGFRPCVVVQNNGGNRAGVSTIVCTITDSRAFKGYAQQVLVPARELGPGGKDSMVECGQIRTIDIATRMNQRLGVTSTLSEETMALVNDALKASLALD